MNYFKKKPVSEQYGLSLIMFFSTKIIRKCILVYVEVLYTVNRTKPTSAHSTLPCHLTVSMFILLFYYVLKKTCHTSAVFN